MPNTIGPLNGDQNDSLSRLSRITEGEVMVVNEQASPFGGG